MLRGAGHRALVLACLPILAFAGPLGPEAARAADVTYSTPTTAADGTAGANGAPVGANGNTGASAITVTGGDRATIDATMVGGNGGSGGAGSTNAAPQGGRGGDGGSGVTAAASTTILFNQAVTGGNGGSGGSATVTATTNAYGGAGGNGGAAAAIGNLATVTVGQTLTGGNGGLGGGANRALGQGGSGGAGGSGLTIGASTVATINGSLIGGNGGNGGGGVGVPGGGGAGGTGLTTTGASAAVTIHGNVTGGNGGLGNGAGAPGAGGVGVQGSSLSLTLAGTAIVTGGMSGNNATRANAISFTGGTNRLEFWSGATVTGNVVASGTSTFALGGAANGGFDLSQIGPAAQYRGFGILAKSGTGTWTLSNTPGAAMAWQVEAGTLDLGGTTQTATALTLTGGTVRNGMLSSSASFSLQAGTIAAILAGSGGLAKTGTGEVTLAGANTYTGATTVSAGKLIVNGSIASSSSLTVNAGGTLGGSGTVGTTAIAGGTLAPGNSIGTLSVAGNLSFTAGSTYMVEVSPGNADRIDVTGAATLGGAKVAAIFDAGTYVARQYTILNATGGVSGSFGSKIDTNLPSGFKSGLSYDARNVYLDLTLDFTPTPVPPTPDAPKRPPNSGLAGNPLSVANALTGFFDRTGGIPVVFGSLTQSGLAQVSGEPVTGTQQTSASAMNQFMTSLADIAPEGRGRRDRAGAVGLCRLFVLCRQGPRPAGQDAAPRRRPRCLALERLGRRFRCGAVRRSRCRSRHGRQHQPRLWCRSRRRLPDFALDDRRLRARRRHHQLQHLWPGLGLLRPVPGRRLHPPAFRQELSRRRPGLCLAGRHHRSQRHRQRPSAGPFQRQHLVGAARGRSPLRDGLDRRHALCGGAGHRRLAARLHRDRGGGPRNLRIELCREGRHPDARRTRPARRCGPGSRRPAAEIAGRRRLDPQWQRRQHRPRHLPGPAGRDLPGQRRRAGPQRLAHHRFGRTQAGQGLLARHQLRGRILQQRQKLGRKRRAALQLVAAPNPASCPRGASIADARVNGLPVGQRGNTLPAIILDGVLLYLIQF